MFNQILHSDAALRRALDATRVPAALGATTGATHATACKCTHTQLDHLGALCNHLEEASACFAAPPSGVYSDNLRRRNLSPEGEHKLPSPCSVTWNSNPGADGSNPSSTNAYQWAVHFLPEDFLEVIEGLFADGRLNAIRPCPCPCPQDPEPGVPGASGAPGAPCAVYLAGKFDIEVHHSLDESGHSYCYELGFTPEAMSSIRLYALVSQEDLGNIRAELARYGVQLPEEEE